MPESLQREFNRAANNHDIGTQMVSKTDAMTVWHILLAPGQRIAAHCHDKPYFWTVMTDGKGRSRFGDGRVIDIEYRAGDTRFFDLNSDTAFIHDLENTGPSDLIFVTVEFPST
ncbi:cupin [Thalassospira profundimaris]|uniref:Cupin n=1 Tax=Thalassospira profundimaris TaxID=502049 RepID=A0A367W5S3_9PROT|nr:cupin [Thalassospira profundimaris]